MKFSANLGFLWKELPFLERIAAARRAQFQAVEFHDHAQAEDPARLSDALAGLEVVGLNVHMGETAGCAAIPSREGEARSDIDAAIATARLCGAKAVHILAGRTDDPGADEAYKARLLEASEEAPELTFLIEPICEQAIPGYFVKTLEQAADIVAALGRDNVKIMFDCFHVQRAGGDVLARYKTHREAIGHIQIAGGLTRAEPDNGELNYRFLLPAFQEAGYDGAFGCEYVPSGTVEAGLGWRKPFL